MTRYLVDNSVLQRLPRSRQIHAAVTEILADEHELCSCAATLDEFAYSARSATEHAAAVHRLRNSFLYLPMAPAIDQIIIDIRAALFVAGKGRAAGVIDVQIAATAIHHHATVLHYDSDYDHITGTYPSMNNRPVLPRGSVDLLPVRLHYCRGAIGRTRRNSERTDPLRDRPHRPPILASHVEIVPSAPREGTSSAEASSGHLRSRTTEIRPDFVNNC